jgi:glycine/D-amino acid oxidase-like deaminating enzyme
VSAPRWTIVGQGLAGTCLAWELWQRGAAFRIIDREFGGSSRIAAGLLNPITGKNFEPSARIAEFLPVALDFYAEMETQLCTPIWHPLPVLRLADTEKEWRKMVSKFEVPEVARWLAKDPDPITIDGWAGAIEVHGGGRIDTRAFLDASREFFKSSGIYQKSDTPPATGTIQCEGAAGLISGKYGPHRCAKGEILTIRADGWDDSRIRVGAGGWLVPLGQGFFKAGSTYEWNELDEVPTATGCSRVTQIIHRLGGDAFEVVRHDAGIRPILRRSEPLIGPLEHGNWMFNGLGSKGGLYAPGMAKRLANWLIDGIEPENEVDFRRFRSS